jgi:hypothetical protein
MIKLLAICVLTCCNQRKPAPMEPPSINSPAPNAAVEPWTVVFHELRAGTPAPTALPDPRVFVGWSRNKIVQTIGEPSWVCTGLGKPCAPCTQADQSVYSLYLPPGSGGRELVISYDSGGTCEAATSVVTRAGLHGLQLSTSASAAVATNGIIVLDAGRMFEKLPTSDPKRHQDLYYSMPDSRFEFLDPSVPNPSAAGVRIANPVLRVLAEARRLVDAENAALVNYDVESTIANSIVTIHLVPHLAPGEKATIGGRTSLGPELTLTFDAVTGTLIKKLYAR